MKWIKTHNGNIIRLGAVSEFIPDGGKMTVRIGEVIETVYDYDLVQQAKEAYDNLLDFIEESETGNKIFYLPVHDSNVWLKQFDINELNLSIRSYNACIRSGLETVYDLMPDINSGKEKEIRNIGRKGMEELIQKRNEFVENQMKMGYAKK